MRILIDTNTLLSAFIFLGPELRLLEEAKAKEVSLLISEHIVEESIQVLQRKFPSHISSLMGFIQRARIHIIPSKRYDKLIQDHVLRDVKDRHVLAAATAARCDAIVTGDKDLLSIGGYQCVPILSTQKALQQLAKC